MHRLICLWLWMHFRDMPRSADDKRAPSNNQLPRVIQEPSVWEVWEGKTARLPCVAHGHPSPQYYWFRDTGGQLTLMDTVRKFSVVDGTLVIHKVSVADSGKYICFANNSVGEDKVDRLLRIRVWVKDQRRIVPDHRIRRVSQTHLKILVFQREDSGIYQCYVYNDWESSQAHVQLDLKAEGVIESFLIATIIWIMCKNKCDLYRHQLILSSNNVSMS
ncbi:down syndrome cell adhesion molecule-like protein Dscam2 [Trichonephila inaurata madagascariensis]|uniref:Down syndrome cell adhesion molecule-like protein Dscam2 n=1 Tax=Trichonephila inaurata madagascariensis TaxID=2747483 RepID=A0A8X6YJF6_9ARAC|nr:down syndrome cell adhesion molecule-like protein Dscam2 [Trichonephila inaurata madagascariensis]